MSRQERFAASKLRRLSTATLQILLVFGLSLGCAWVGLGRGYQEGQNHGYNVGKMAGYKYGYRAGYRDGTQQAESESASSGMISNTALAER